MFRTILLLFVSLPLALSADFSLPEDVYLGSDPKEVNVADLDSDGNKDIIFVDNGSIKVLYQGLTGSSKYSVLLDGTSEEFQIPSAINLKQGDFTFSVWVNALSGPNPNDWMYIWKSESFQLRLKLSTGQLLGGVTFEDSSSEAININGFNPSSDSWYHIAFTMNSSTGESVIYVDGEVLGAKTFNGRGALLNTGDLIHLGGGVGYGYAGFMDEVSYFGKALTEVEIRQIYGFREYVDLSTLDTSLQLVSWWTMGDHSEDIFNGYYDPSLLKDNFGTNDGSPIDTEPSDKSAVSFK